MNSQPQLAQNHRRKSNLVQAANLKLLLVIFDMLIETFVNECIAEQRKRSQKGEDNKVGILTRDSDTALRTKKYPSFSFNNGYSFQTFN